MRARARFVPERPIARCYSVHTAGCIAGALDYRELLELIRRKNPEAKAEQREAHVSGAAGGRARGRASGKGRRGPTPTKGRPAARGTTG